ncbi:MAG: hypothetical protein H6Q67_2174 [Firmicutes bacterium]|nr:hypothetical protein [Bacillota bacterium]
MYCDESEQKGQYYSNFFGGALVRSSNIEEVESTLNNKKEELNLFGEVKWQKITHNYLDKYLSFIDTVFNFIEKDKIKIRIMFRQNATQPVGLTREQVDEEYFRLYYQFLKHAFGLPYSNPIGEEIYLRIFLDQLPDKKERCEKFKDYIYGLQNMLGTANIKIRKRDIAEIRSHNHVILQSLDVILGSMNFKLNNLHLQKPDGSRFRGKKTIAKEKVYKYINQRIRNIYPNFNIGISTGTLTIEDRWNHPYRHWCFMPSNHTIDMTKYKPK